MTDLYYADPVAELPVKLKSRTVGEAEVPSHDCESLPGTVQADIAAVAAALVGAITTHLEKLADAITADRMAVNLDATSLAKLDSIISGQAAPGALYGGKTTVTTPGTRVPLGASQPLTEGVLLRGLDANTQLVYPGNASVSATAGGTRLAAKEPAFIRANNVNLIYLDAAIAGEGVTWVGW
jgi:hypothetical protein